LRLALQVFSLQSRLVNSQEIVFEIREIQDPGEGIEVKVMVCAAEDSLFVCDLLADFAELLSFLRVFSDSLTSHEKGQERIQVGVGFEVLLVPMDCLGNPNQEVVMPGVDFKVVLFFSDLQQLLFEIGLVENLECGCLGNGQKEAERREVAWSLDDQVLNAWLHVLQAHLFGHETTNERCLHLLAQNGVVDGELVDLDVLDVNVVVLKEGLPHCIASQFLQSIRSRQLNLSQFVQSHEVQQIQPEHLLDDFHLGAESLVKNQAALPQLHGLGFDFGQLLSQLGLHCCRKHTIFQFHVL